MTSGRWLKLSDNEKYLLRVCISGEIADCEEEAENNPSAEFKQEMATYVKSLRVLNKKLGTINPIGYRFDSESDVVEPIYSDS